MLNHQKEWERLGQTNPYFGVLTYDEYRAENFDEEKRQKFYASGEKHIDDLLALLKDLYGFETYGSALDLGCGVGRLVVPLARRFRSVTGIDVSPSMIELAKARAEEVGVNHIRFYSRVADTEGTFDFAHSYIVLQHIPSKIGLEIIDDIATRMNPGGLIALHMVLLMDRSAIRRIQNAIRKRFTLWHYAINVVTGYKWNEPLQEMNAYPLNRVLYTLHKRGFERVQLVTRVTTEFGPSVFYGFVLAQRNDPLAKRLDF